MTALSIDSVAIDTNVFLHLLDRDINCDKHVNELLGHLYISKTALIVDNGDRIAGEYGNFIDPILRNKNVELDELYSLRYWSRVAPRKKVIVKMGDELMRSIKRVVREPSESLDRILVYVALRSGKSLITNDRFHILCGPQHENGRSRRDRLLRQTKRTRSSGSCILSSREAHATIGQP